MSEFAEASYEVIEESGLVENIVDLSLQEKISSEEKVDTTASIINPFFTLIDFSRPLRVVYCPHCTLPPDLCEFGPCYDKCLPWIMENFPEILTESNEEDGEGGEDGEKKKKSRRGGSSVPKKKAAPPDIKVVLQLLQRQKRKMITVVTGIETIPDAKIKDVARLFGKKFSSGASVTDTASGGKEIVIQGDVMFPLPELLIKDFKVPSNAIFLTDQSGNVRCYAD